jgi:hypothetical protein
VPYLCKSRKGCEGSGSAVALDTRFHRLRGQSEEMVGAGALSALVNAGEARSHRVSAEARLELNQNERTLSVQFRARSVREWAETEGVLEFNQLLVLLHADSQRAQ